MFNAIIVDDERPALDVLRLFLERTGQICVVGSFLRAADALAEICDLEPDVVFLDIEIPEISGIELAEKIIEVCGNTEIVFVTAYEKYAIEAFRVNAIDYILKPFTVDDIAHVITRLNKVRALRIYSSTDTDAGRVYCFGRLSVYGSGCPEAVKWRTTKAEELFAFMLQNLNRSVAKWKVVQELWPEYETSKQINTHLYTTVYKVKQTLSLANVKYLFTFTNGSYKMELPGIYIDTSEFEAITDSGIAFSAASVERYKAAIGLYKGNYLDENGYLWAQSKAGEYQKRYCGLVSELAHYYEANGDCENAEKILCNALTIVPLDDTLNEQLLKLLFAKRDKPSLVMQYKKVKELYEAELGIAPSASMRDLFSKSFEL